MGMFLELRNHFCYAFLLEYLSNKFLSFVSAPLSHIQLV